MKFAHRTLVVGGTVSIVLIYFYIFILETPPEPEHLPYISDKYGEECTHQGVTYQEGEVFFSPCQECYCSFGRVECAVVHCKDIRNTLGLDLISRSVQVLIPTCVEDFPGTVAVMNSVLKHTTHKVKFTLVLYQEDDDPIHSSHLRNWIAGTELRTADYVIIPFNDRAKEWVGTDTQHMADFWMEYEKKKQKYDKETQSKKIDSFNSDKFKEAFMRLGLSSKMGSNPRTAMLILNTLLPREHRVVVLSNHVIVRGDIADLFRVEMTGYPVAVIKSWQHPLPSRSLHFKDLFKPPLLSQYNIPGDKPLYSPGLILADLDAWFSAEIEYKLSRTFANLLASEDNLANKEGDSFAAILLHFWNNSSDLGSAWNVSNLGNTDCDSDIADLALQETKLIDWGFQKPWKCNSTFSLWSKYFVFDPTGMFRLKQRDLVNVDIL